MQSEVVTLGSVCSIKQGKYLASTEMSELPTGSCPVPVIGGNGVLGYTSRPSHSRDVVLVTCRGSRCGLLQWVKAPVWVSNNAMACDAGSDEANLLLRYALANVSFDDVTTGSAQPQITVGHLSTKPITLPERHQWRAIVGVLKALDDRIDLLRQTNATLESIAQALFKSWFIDFDPVRAKAEGREPEGMDVATAALFPAEFEESALGVVPAGWQVQQVREVVADVFDGPHATPAEATEGPAFLGIKNLTGTAMDLSQIRHIAEADYAQWTRRVTPKANDIVFSYEAALGLFALIPPDLRCCLGRRLALVRAKPVDGTPHFWFHQFVGAPFQRTLTKHTVQGATVNRIALKEFPSFPVLEPGTGPRLAFEAVAAPLWARIHANQQQALALVELRDTLLPRLISGKLRLPEAQAMMESTP